jgi:hypothetical protein
MWRKPQSEDLEKSRRARISRQQLERQDEYVSLLRRAAALRIESGDTTDVLDVLIDAGQTEQRKLQDRVGGRIFPRRRPTGRQPAAADSCYFFLDECGSHAIGPANDPFPVFVLTAAIVRQSAWPDFDRKWREWKQQYLGSADIVVHEPDVRHGDWPFGGPKRQEVVEQLRRVIAELEFTALVCVVRRDAYAELHGAGPLDESLPSHLYLMSLDFITERLALALDGYFNGGRAKVIAESRGPKEDALLQYEFGRLQLQGTSYISSGSFRQQVHPGITFESKGGEFSSGLQIADLLGRPCADKVLNPESDPPRWAEFRDKLCPGRETENSVIGLKIVPWDDRFSDIWRPPEKEA